MYQYLEAVRHFGMLDATQSDAAAQAELKQSLAQLRKQIEASADDDSIAAIFLERAESMAVATAKPDEWKSVKVTVEQVHPRLLRRSPPAAPLAQKTARRSRSRSSAGPTLETSPTRQVCWYRKSRRKFPGSVTFVSENFGASKLAEKYGVKGYPAVFVDGVLVASPREFGYFGEKEGTGRYAPWRNAVKPGEIQGRPLPHDRADPGRTQRHRQPGASEFGRAVAGDRRASEIHTHRSCRQAHRVRAACRPRGAGRVLGHLVPAVPFHPRTGSANSSKSTETSWPSSPSPSSLRRPKSAPQSASITGDLHWAITDAKTAQAFGDITAVPTMFLFDRSGKTAQVLYGAPPDLHAQVEKTLASLLQ